MKPKPRLQLASIGLLGLVVSACSPTGKSSGGAASAPTASEVSGLPDLGLRNVETETANARATTVGRDGGTVTATASDGTTFVLDIPAGAVGAPTQVALYPVAQVTGLPAGDSLAAGVQFAPDGLQLLAAASLTIKLPSGANATDLVGLAWEGDGTKPDLYPMLVDADTLTLPILHFSGAGAGRGPHGEPPSAADFQAGSCGDVNTLMTRLESMVRAFGTNLFNDSDQRFLFSDWLKRCYLDLVQPALQGVIDEFETGTNSTTSDALPQDLATQTLDLDLAVGHAYLGWRAGLDIAQRYLHDSSYTVTPELSQAKALLVRALRAFFGETNRDCIADQLDANVDVPIQDADRGVDRASFYASAFGVGTAANKLDLQSLLDASCVKVVVDPSRNYSGNQPGASGVVTVPVGFTIADGPERTDRPIEVQLSLTGAETPFATIDNKAGVPTAPLDWPAPTDPIKVDVLATLELGDGTRTSLARFDRITKGSRPPTPPPNATPSPPGTQFMLEAGANPTVQTCGVTQVLAWVNGRPTSDSVTWAASGVTVRQLLPGEGSVQVIVGSQVGTLTVMGTWNDEIATIDITVVQGATNC